MSLYKQPGSNVWWYEFRFAGERIRESTKTKSKKLAEDAQRARRRQLEVGFNGIQPKELPKRFAQAAEEFLAAKTGTVAPKTLAILIRSVQRLNKFLGPRMLHEITASDVKKLQTLRLAEGAAPRYANMEIEALRGILRRNGLWEAVRPDVSMLKPTEEIGIALSEEEMDRLLDECRKSQSRNLYPAVFLALSTGMRLDEVRLLRWMQIDFRQKAVTVGRSKTEAGRRRKIALNRLAITVLQEFADLFPDRESNHYVFPTERCAGFGPDGQLLYYNRDPAKPIGSWKTAWNAVRRRAKVQCRFHDLRHTAFTRMISKGIPLMQVASIAGWSASNTILMAKKYGHLEPGMKKAVATLEWRRKSNYSKRKIDPHVISISPDRARTGRWVARSPSTNRRKRDKKSD